MIEIDSNIINEAKRNKSKFNELIKLIENDLYRVIRFRLNNQDDIDEAFQETIINIYKNLNKLKNPKKFKFWSISIAINECNKIYKKRSSNLYNIDEYENLIFDDVNIKETESNINFKEILSLLSKDENTLMNLYYGENFTTKEISKMLRIPEGTVKSKLSRCREKVKKYLSKGEWNYGLLW